MDFFLAGTLLFLLANITVAVTMLRRVNLHNDSVLAWEQEQAVALRSAPVQQLAVTSYNPAALPKAA